MRNQIQAAPSKETRKISGGSGVNKSVSVQLSYENKDTYRLELILHQDSAIENIYFFVRENEIQPRRARRLEGCVRERDGCEKLRFLRRETITLFSIFALPPHP